jgi:hypothetical protein
MQPDFASFAFFSHFYLLKSIFILGRQAAQFRHFKATNMIEESGSQSQGFPHLAP